MRSPHLSRSQRRAARQVIGIVRRSYPPNGVGLTDIERRMFLGIGFHIRLALAQGSRRNTLIEAELYKPPARSLASSRFCANCAKVTQHGKDGKCENYGKDRSWCMSCDHSTSHHGKVCTEHRDRSCTVCKALTPHRDGKCMYDRDTHQYCVTCQQFTKHHGRVCKEHTVQNCDACGKETPHRGGKCVDSSHRAQSAPRRGFFY